MISQRKKFGILFFVVFLIIVFWPMKFPKELDK